nr:immunoglobulin light chain junction region [Macaca mulatta]MOW07954.1 immunoglobulin light chain junction region [Macaca mulatta]MOW08960.1 immunoglobulin light chain junction region [Macaca mulatta]MOW09514.1 immunoglobulin light chain junction region [Macaca mulatta]MOW09862.1 immunoglobulin light chain junction region [Macaca mulatta]
CLQGYTIPWTF